MNNNEITFEITEKIGVLENYTTGWNKEINMVSWNGNPPKYDIRDWSPDHSHMSRGITLTEDQMGRLIKHIIGSQDDDTPFN